MLSVPLYPTLVNGVEDYSFLSYFILKNLILVTMVLLINHVTHFGYVFKIYRTIHNYIYYTYYGVSTFLC